MGVTTAGGRPEVWAGVECTVNRVGDRYFDQMQSSGHDRRVDDLDRVCGLGVMAVRYPVLWERTAPGPTGAADWSWPDVRLGRLRALGVRPIVGLVHHGSGPPHTSLHDPGFADGLAAYAGRVAERYPWVDAYTPVNEPLTTARFSGLYGHWYPHGRCDWAFATALLTQCRGVALAMRAVRRVNPAAVLVQTDDLGVTHAALGLQYQADFENERRWVTWDLLAGRVTRTHPLWGYFQGAGVPEADVAWFADHPCPPDVVGVNYYLTSERFLDGRLDRYPPSQRGGNGRAEYADVEAVRILPAGLAGVGAVLREAWGRYRLPVAVTEVHLGCTRDEQIRWLWEVWTTACQLRADGVDVRAVTAWAAFGTYDWDSLVTRPSGRYEPGAFDVRADPPRPTAIAGLVCDLAAGREPDHPALDAPGWWRRPDRLLVPDPTAVLPPRNPHPRPVLITGGDGRLGRAFARVCDQRGLHHVRLARRELDIADPEGVLAAVARHRPWAVVNAAGFARVDAAEADPARCRRDNAYGPAVLAAVCGGHGIKLVTFSSDLVFDGLAGRPYQEADPVAPLNVYGSAKAEAEERVRTLAPDALVVRTGALFGPCGRRDFVARALATLRGGGVVVAAGDLTITPSYIPDLTHTVLDLLIDGERGVWHLASPDPITWADLARLTAERARLDPAAVAARPAVSFGWPAHRPAYSALGTTRGLALSPLTNSLDRYIRSELPSVTSKSPPCEPVTL